MIPGIQPVITITNLALAMRQTAGMIQVRFMARSHLVETAHSYFIMAKKKKTAKETFDRNYWTAEELDILRAHRDHWLSEKTGLRRTTYELGTVAIAIAELNPAKYGSEAIEKDAQLKDKWLRCCKVRCQNICSMNH